jgi:hypothetical protein
MFTEPYPSGKYLAASRGWTALLSAADYGDRVFRQGMASAMPKEPGDIILLPPLRRRVSGGEEAEVQAWLAGRDG